MSLKVLYKDEMKGFYKSKVMAALLIGLPLLSILMRLVQMDTEGINMSSFTALIVGSLGGTLGSVMLGTNISKEIQEHVYDLFLIRPVKRWEIIISKYLAVFTCLILATFFSIGLSVAFDYARGMYAKQIVLSDLKNLLMIFGTMSMACSFGIVIGTMAKSVAVSSILSIYIGNQVTGLVVIPGLLIPGVNEFVLTPILGFSVTILLLGLSVLRFKKMQF